MVQTLFTSRFVGVCPAKLCALGRLLAFIPHLISDYGFSVHFEIRRFDLSCSDLCVCGMDTDGVLSLSGLLNFISTAEVEKLLYDH